MEKKHPKVCKFRHDDFVSAQQMGIDFSEPRIRVVTLGKSVFRVEISPSISHPAYERYTTNIDTAIDISLEMRDKHYQYILN